MTKNDTTKKLVPLRAAVARKGTKPGRSPKDIRVETVVDETEGNRQQSISELLKRVNKEDDEREERLNADAKERERAYTEEMERKRAQAKEIASQRRAKYGMQTRSREAGNMKTQTEKTQDMIDNEVEENDENEGTPKSDNRRMGGKIDEENGDDSKRVLFKETRETIKDKGCVYFDLNFTVEKSLTAVEEMREGLVKVFSILKGIDSSIKICKFIEGKNTLEKDALEEDGIEGEISF